MGTHDVQYVYDTEGQQVSVIIPIDLWREIATEREALRGEKDVMSGMAHPGGENPVSSMTLEEAGIEISPETGLPVFRVPPDAPRITTEFVRQLEEEW